MAEDYTYEPVTDVTTLAARVQELEAALREQCGLTAQLIEQRTELEARLNATGFALANSALIQRVRELEAQLNAAIVGRAELERENAELRKAYEPVERSFRVVWTACAFGYEGTPVGEALNHIKAWFDGVRL